MPAINLQLPTQYRSLKIVRTAIDEEKRTVSLSFCSETVVERYYGNEILDCTTQSCDLSRLLGSAPLLVNHDPGDQVGVVESATMDADRVGRAVVRFGNSQRAQEIFQDVKDGIRSLVSVGYMVNEMRLESISEDVETLRVTSWKPFEISLVAVPADATVGVGRSTEASTTAPVVIHDPMKIRKFQKFHEPDTGSNATSGSASTVTVEQEVERRLTAENSRRDGIATVVEQAKKRGVDLTEAAKIAIRDKQALNDFQRHAFEQVTNATPVTTDPNLGMSDKEVRSYSLTRALNTLANQRPLDGLERECSVAMEKRVGRSAAGFFIPHDVAGAGASPELMRALRPHMNKRDLAAGTQTAGGYTVQTDVLGGSLIELLRNRITLRDLGAMMLSGLVGNVAIPAQTGGATAYWLAENGTATKSAQTFGQLALTPHRLAAQTAWSKLLLAQSSIDIEAFVRLDLAKILAIEMDRVGITGLGASGEPLGIFNTTGVGSKTFGVAGAPTYKELVNMKTKVAQANALMGSTAYLSTPIVQEYLGTTPKIGSTFPVFILGDDGKINGERAEFTNQVPSDKMIFGNFNDLILADWAGMDIVVDPYTLAGDNQIKVTINLQADVGIRHAKSFTISTNAAGA